MKRKNPTKRNKTKLVKMKRKKKKKKKIKETKKNIPLSVKSKEPKT